MRGLAFAKINLSLEVTGKRPDGYHELVSIMQTISLADELSLDPADDLRLDCDDPALAGPENLVMGAARLLGRAGRFVLRKGIPVAAGLGGGSSDAALALRLLNAAYDLGLPASDMTAAAAELGSDVPFFLTGGTALVEGRGERVTPLPDLPVCWLVLLNPGIPLSTAAVYKELRPEEWTDGVITRRWTPERLERNGLPPGMNGLAEAAGRVEPKVRESWLKLADAGTYSTLVSGSGPTSFGLAPTEAEAYKLASSVDGSVARFVGRGESLTLEP